MYISSQYLTFYTWILSHEIKSQAFKANGTIYLAGQIAADRDGNLITGNITEKAEQIFRNSEAILRAAGSELTKVVKVTVTAYP
jgi:enamine deaminase RidA (YjgF/YER057c/UK114 family)